MAISDIPVIGNFLGNLLGEQTGSEKEYLDAIKRAQQEYEAFRPEYQQMQEQALQNQMGALSGWDQLLSEIYGSQYLPKTNTESPVTAAGRDSSYASSTAYGAQPSLESNVPTTGIAGWAYRQKNKRG